MKKLLSWEDRLEEMMAKGIVSEADRCTFTDQYGTERVRSPIDLYELGVARMEEAGRIAEDPALVANLDSQLADAETVRAKALEARIGQVNAETAALKVRHLAVLQQINDLHAENSELRAGIARVKSEIKAMEDSDVGRQIQTIRAEKLELKNATQLSVSNVMLLLGLARIKGLAAPDFNREDALADPRGFSAKVNDFLNQFPQLA
ncbi:MAG: hypothetical protein V4555_16460 [Acidobacteriota bacterium]